MLTLHHVAPSRSSTILWMLEEIGQPYEVRLLNLKAGETRGPAHLALNPMGKVPVLEHDGQVITETAAICLHLADAFPAAGLAPPPGDPARGQYYRWVVFGPAVFEPAILDRMLDRPPGPPGALGYGDFDTAMAVLAARLQEGDWLLGTRFSAADIVIGAGLGWAMMMRTVPERPEFMAYAGRIMARPARMRALARDQALMRAETGDPAPA